MNMNDGGGGRQAGGLSILQRRLLSQLENRSMIIFLILICHLLVRVKKSRDVAPITHARSRRSPFICSPISALRSWFRIHDELVLFGPHDLNLGLKPFGDLFEQDLCVFFGLAGRKHNYRAAMGMFYLTGRQHFHNKPLFCRGSKRCLKNKQILGGPAGRGKA